MANNEDIAEAYHDSDDRSLVEICTSGKRRLISDYNEELDDVQEELDVSQYLSGQG